MTECRRIKKKMAAEAHSHEFLFPGNLTGPASAAIACNEWNVLPILSHSLVPMFGAEGPRGRWRMRPPDLLTMNRWRNPMVSDSVACGLRVAPTK